MRAYINRLGAGAARWVAGAASGAGAYEAALFEVDKEKNGALGTILSPKNTARARLHQHARVSGRRPRASRRTPTNAHKLTRVCPALLRVGNLAHGAYVHKRLWHQDGHSPTK
jgi:hypothetical protein